MKIKFRMKPDGNVIFFDCPYNLLSDRIFCSFQTKFDLNIMMKGLLPNYTLNSLSDELLSLGSTTKSLKMPSLYTNTSILRYETISYLVPYYPTYKA